MRIFTCILIFLFFTSFYSIQAQIIADFETPALTPVLSQGGAEVRTNPNKNGNASDHAAYYQKASGNWQAININFAGDQNVGKNDRLTFKIYNSTVGRVYVKVDNGSTVLLENWAPDYNFQPSAGVWTECSFDITALKDKTFNKLEVNASVDNNAVADVYLDDFRLSNSSSPNGEPILILNVSSTQITAGQSVHFDASTSYDSDGSITSFTWNFGDSNTGSGSVVDHVYGNEGIYKASLIIQDNEGKQSSKDIFIYVFAVGGKITQLHFTTPELLTYKKIEGIFAISDTYTNVYNPDEVSIDATITLPDASIITVPCFYFEKATYQPDNWTKDGSNGFWMIRFTSAQTGQHKIILKRKDVNGTVTSNEQTFTVNQGTEKGFIKQAQNKQYFRHTSGEPFYPLGINVAWNTTSLYTNIINSLSASGANLVRYWQVPFDRQGLEWKNGNSFYKGLGIYSQEAAAEQDSMLNLCEAKNMYMQITLFQHGMFSENVDSNWSDNPYNSANGGMLTKAEQYFYNADAKARTKKLLRYIVARWGYSTHVFAWELFNEVQFTGNHPNQSATWSTGVNTWHDEMGQYVKSLDAFHHIVTTSADDARLPVLDKLDGVDVVQYHLYSSNLIIDQISQDKKFLSSVSSIINGEYGTNNSADVPFEDQRTSIWASIMKQVPHYMWRWESYTDPAWAGLFECPAAYLNGEDFSSEGTLSDWIFTATYGATTLNTVGFNSSNNFYAFIYDASARANLSGVVCNFSKLPEGNYEISYYNVTTGNKVVVNDYFYSGKTTLTLPKFSKAIAIKVKFVSALTLPIANAGPDKVVLIEKEATVQGSSSFNPSASSLSYAWTLVSKPASSNTTLSDADNVIAKFTPDQLGEYKLSLVVSNDAGLSLADTVVVIADNVTGINEILNSSFHVYPNPAHDQFYFDIPITDHDIDVEVIDVMGRALLTKHFNRLDTNRSVSIKDHVNQSGIYLVRLKSATFVGVRRIQLTEN